MCKSEDNKQYFTMTELLHFADSLYNLLMCGYTVIITGSKGSGKSYFIDVIKQKLINESKSFAGIQTKAIRDNEFYPKAILLYYASSNVRAGVLGGNRNPPHAQFNSTTATVAKRNPNGIGLTPNPEAFNGTGTELLRNATNMDIVIIDEIGFLEETADDYKQTIREVIIKKPTILVLAKRDTPFIKELMVLEKATIFDLDEKKAYR